jgi:hypothetical protein
VKASEGRGVCRAPTGRYAGSSGAGSRSSNDRGIRVAAPSPRTAIVVVCLPRLRMMLALRVGQLTRRHMRDHVCMRYCTAAEDRHVGHDSPQTVMMAQSGTQVAWFHAVQVLASEPASRAVCGKEYSRLGADINWEDPTAATNDLRCASCIADTGFGR